jgi:hypothetical protein
MAAIEAHLSSRGGDDRGDATLRPGWSRRGSGGGVVVAGSRRGVVSLHKRQMREGLRPRAAEPRAGHGCVSDTRLSVDLLVVYDIALEPGEWFYSTVELSHLLYQFDFLYSMGR